MRYSVISKIGEGNRGEVFKVKLENGNIAAIKWAKNYNIQKEWDILTFLKGKIAPKPIFRGKNYFCMEYIDAKPLKELNKKEYLLALRYSLIRAYELDKLGVNHSQLGRYYHILFTGDDVRFIDFERATFSNNSRNFLQIVGYYLFRDENFDKRVLRDVTQLYKTKPKIALEKLLKEFDESCS